MEEGRANRFAESSNNMDKRRISGACCCVHKDQRGQGAVVANAATAHKLARMVYFMLTRGEEFVDQGQQHYEEQQRLRSVAALRRRATALGFVIAPTAATV